MANNGGSNAFLATVLGGAVLVIAIFAYVMYGGAMPDGKTTRIDVAPAGTGVVK